VKILDVVQGSPGWHDARAQHDCASEAPAVMGASNYVSRNELLKRKATGIEEEIGSDTQRLFDKGHAAEAAIRPYVESLIGEELYPVVGTNGSLLASFDGLTMDGLTGFEHKLWNESLAQAVRDGSFANDPAYYWQLEHQFAVNEEMQRIHFVVSDGTPERCVSAIYQRAPGRAHQLVRGWAQFREDLAAYKPEAPTAVVVAEAVEALPAVGVTIGGSLQVASNLDVFGERLKAFIGAIDRKPDTDQGFANCEAAVKTLKKAEEALESAETAALAQIDPVEAMRRTVATYRELARTTRLALEKVVKHRKDEIRVEIQQKALTGWLSHISTINTRLGRVRLTIAAPDFAGAMKGKKTIEGLRGAVDDLLAKAKIEASQQAEDFASNLKVVDELTANAPAGLFRDLQDLVSISPEHLAGVIRGRLADHEAAEAKRLEAERARIREEEQAKAREEVRITPHTPEAIKPASAAAGAARVVTPGAGAAPTPARPRRPTDAEMIDVLSQHYRVHESKVIEWLLDMDLTKASAEMAKEFS
jgi:predicted phage-related endonuclease